MPSEPQPPVVVALDGLPPAVVRSRLDAYLACSALTEGERRAALDFLAEHPELGGVAPPAPSPESMVARAELVLRLHAESRALVPAMPAGMARFRAAAEALARDLVALFGDGPPAP